MSSYTKALRVIGGILIVYALLVATHRGEFWPFSIYPMFSQAGNPWTRSVVRTLPDGETPSWEATSLQNLPGNPFPLQKRGVNQNDVSNYVSKTDEWTSQRVKGLRRVFASTYDFSRPLLVIKARGELVDDSVAVTATPLILYTSDSTHLHPSIKGPPGTAARTPSMSARLRSMSARLR